MNTTKGFINPLWLLVVLVVIVLGGGAAYWYTQQPAFQEVVRQPIVLPVAEEAKVIEQESGQSMLNTVDAVRKALSAADPGYYKSLEMAGGGTVEVTIVEEGARYVLFNIMTYRTIGPPGRIFDKQTGQIIGALPTGMVGKTERGRVIISWSDICYYTIDKPACTQISGAKLGDSEIYPAFVDAQGLYRATTTDTTLIVDVLTKDSMDQSNEETKVRTATFTLPQ